MALRLHSSVERLGPGAAKTYRARIESGFFAAYLSGDNILDIGHKGRDPDAVPIMPHAIGVDLDYPGYDGTHLPFADESQDAVHASHCLEHIADWRGALADWFRVLRIGGFLVIAVPHKWLYERKPALPSRFNAGHVRFYTIGSLAAEIETALPAGCYRVRLLRDNDARFDYSLPPLQHAKGCFEIELVVEKIAPPAYCAQLEFSAAARTIIATYEALIRRLLQDGSATLDHEHLTAIGRALPIPPLSVIAPLFPDAPPARLRELLWPLVDPAVVEREWYQERYPGVRAAVERGELADAAEHYRRHGYFEGRLARPIDPLYG